MLLEAADAADVPAPDVAVTVKVYAVPEDKPDTVIGLDAPVPVNDPGELVTVYEVIGSLENEGALNVTLAVVEVGDVAVPIVGAPGAALAPLENDPRIGMFLLYPNLAERDLVTRQQLLA